MFTELIEDWSRLMGEAPRRMNFDPDPVPPSGYRTAALIHGRELDIRFAGGDGSTPEHAIRVIGARSHEQGIHACYAWLAILESECDCQVGIQSREYIEIAGHHYDHYVITAGDERRELYFSLDEFWGLAEESTLAAEGEVDSQVSAVIRMVLGSAGPAEHRTESPAAPQAHRAPASATNAVSAAAPRLAPADSAPAESIETLLADLDALVGLDEIKQRVRSLVNRITLAQRRRSAGQEPAPIALHMAFLGSPGTGKTTVARLVSRIYRALGLVAKGHLVETDRSGLVAGYMGQTALKTREQVEQARGGVLFVDEAYALAREGVSSQDYGREAVDTLVKLMEDLRSELAVVFAGYSEEMEAFFASNPGLRSRVGHMITFPDYSPAELLEILERSVREHELKLSYDARSKAAAWLAARHEQRDRSFGNAREVRQLADAIHGRMADRLAALPQASGEVLNTILARDVPDAPGSASVETLESVMSELDALIGLEPVKHHFHSLVAYQQARMRRAAAGLVVPSLSLHAVYVGNAGSGKTTVARLYSRALRALGLVRRGHLVEVDRSGLVASYLGQTAQRVREVFESARGGVLFIDEAYALLGSGAEPDAYGAEAVATLLKLVEDQRHEVAVVLAGYPQPMARFLASNPGLSSRFARVVEFPDYSELELIEIFAGFAAAHQLELAQGLRERLGVLFADRIDGEGHASGNGRLARNLFEEALLSQSRRLAETSAADPASLARLLPEDLPEAPKESAPSGGGNYV
jgi:SpoVK/Ycf46/Vps4 family AAA+-type ATPase